MHRGSSGSAVWEVLGKRRLRSRTRSSARGSARSITRWSRSVEPLLPDLALQARRDDPFHRDGQVFAVGDAAGYPTASGAGIVAEAHLAGVVEEW
jgi:hypothetical protein